MTEREALRILVVDDDEVDRLTVRRGLSRAGIAAEIVEVRSAELALAAIAAAPFDCVFLDYHLPGADGHTALARLRAASPELPIIMLTGQGDEEVAVALMKAGAVDYLPKSSATAERLAASVRYALELSRANAQTRRMHDELREIALRATASAERMGHLQRVTAALADVTSSDGLPELIAREAILPLGAYAGCIAMRVGNELELRASVGYPDAACMGRGRRWPLDAAIPIAEAIRTAAPVYVESPQAWAQRYGDGSASPAARKSASQAWAALPLMVSGQAEGAILWTYAAPRSFSDDDRALLQAIVQQAKQALERARLYESERRARAEAEDANRAKADFLARMSHDLRTPLNAIAGFTDLVLMGLHGPVTPEQREALGRVQRAQQHLLTLINDILSFARLEAGQVQLDIRPVRVEPVMREVRHLVEPQAAAKGLRLESVPGPPDAVVQADEDRLKQILLNLAGNAVKFTAAGSVRLGWFERGSRVVLQVQDTGPGIPPDRLERIFEPFVQGLDAETRAQGVGLGLAISRELSRMMSGRLSVESTLGAGSTFTLELPALDADAASGVVATASRHSDGSPRRAPAL